MFRVAVDLLERQAELRVLESAVELAGEGHGSTVLVLGEAGIGKTTLLRSFFASMSDRVRVLEGSCEDLLTPRPLGPLRDAALAGAGPWSEALEAPTDQTHLLEATAHELEVGPPPTMLVVEDAHWADGATLDVLRHLGRRMHTLPAVLVITFRDDALASDHPLRSVLGGLAGTGAARLRLTCLSAESVGRLASRKGVDGVELSRITGGNPFFVTEALECPDDLVPPTVVDAVLARVGALSPGAMAALERIAMVPSGMEVDLLRMLVADLGPVAEAERAGVLHVRGKVVGFRHELARRAVAQSLPASERIELNAEILKALLDRGDGDLFRILHHAVQAGDDDAVVTYGPDAARAAFRLGAFRQAASCCEQLLARGRLLEPTLRARVGEGYSWALSNSNQVHPAAVAAAVAVGQWEEVGDDARLVRALTTLSRQLWLTEQTAPSRVSAERALVLAREEPGSQQLALAELNLGGLLVLVDREAEGLPHLDVALRLAEGIGSRSLTALAHDYRGSAHLQLGDLDGESELLQSIELARGIGNHEYVMRGYYNLVEGLWRLGRYGEAAAYLDLAEDYARDRDAPVHGYMHEARRHRLAMMHGQWPEAAAGLVAMLDGQGDPGMIGRETIPVLARLRVRQGHADADELLALADEHAMRANVLEWLVPVGLAHIEHAWLSGRPGRSEHYATYLTELLDRPGTEALRGELARYLRRLGREVVPFAECPAGYDAGIRGDWRAAATWWQDAGNPYERALELAESREAEPTLEAFALLDELGAEPALAMVGRRLRALGLGRLPRRAQAGTRANPAGLTDRQLEILRLVGAGLSNVDIAQRLVVSPRTVDHHVSAILQKLGVSNRREARDRIDALGAGSTDRN